MNPDEQITETGPTAPSAETVPAEPAMNWQEAIDTFWTDFVAALEILTTPWALVQIVVILACYLLARFGAQYLTPILEKQIRRIEQQPQLMRVLVVPLRRLSWILFALALWLSAELMQLVTWPSRSYYVMIAATLAAAGVAISIASRFIRNRSIGNIFTFAAIAMAALIIFGLFDETVAALDALAFSFGSFRVSLLLLLKAALFFAALFWLALALGKFSERRIRRNTELAPALQVLLSKVVRFGLLTLATLAAISALGIDLTALTVFSGALGIGLGFGLRSVASNLISGIIILMDRSIKPGDVIEVEGTFGWINSLRARYVSIVTRDGIEYLVPNEHFVTDRVINWSFSSRNVRMEIEFGVDYGSDPHQVREIAVEAVSGLDRILDAPEPVCHIRGFGDSSIDFLLRFWIEDPKGGLANVKGQAFLAIWDAFERAGIKIPYPHREVLVRSADEPVPVRDPFKPAKPKRARSARQIDPAIEG